MNEHQDLADEAINAFDGTIPQFQGDNLIAIFNMAGDQPGHATLAVRAGVALQQAIAAYQTHRPPQEPRLHFGVGINTGMALIGNIGARQRFSYTATGDAVNLAARITGATPPTEVWMSQATYEQLDQTIAVEPLPDLTFKGKSGPTSLYRVKF